MPQIIPLDGTDASIFAQITDLRRQIKDLGNNIVTLPYASSNRSSASLTVSGQEIGTVALSSTWLMLEMQVNRPCRVRLYDTLAHANADASRARGVDPITANNPGVLLDWAFPAGLVNQPVTMTPPIVGAAIPTSVNVPYVIDNLDSSSGVVAVTFTFVTLQP